MSSQLAQDLLLKFKCIRQICIKYFKWLACTFVFERRLAGVEGTLKRNPFSSIRKYFHDTNNAMLATRRHLVRKCIIFTAPVAVTT